jgi:hypothetical protein
MKGRDVPYYTDSDYYVIARPEWSAWSQGRLEAIHQYTTDGLEMIMNGEIGRYNEGRVVEQTVIPAGGAADSTTFDSFANTGGCVECGGSSGLGVLHRCRYGLRSGPYRRGDQGEDPG